MKLRRRKPGQPETRSEEGRLSFAGQCVRVRTPEGRKAHLQHPERGVLCGWSARAWVLAAPELPLCRLCEIEVQVEEMAP